VEEAYNFVTLDIDLQSLVDDVLIELGDFLDLSNLSTAEVSNEIPRL